MKAKIKTRIGTREESKKFAAELAAANYHSAKVDAECISFSDGHPEAIRVQFNRDTGDVLRMSDGKTPRICAPWLMSAFA